MLKMTARYPGKCCITGEPIKPGDPIRFHGKGRAELIKPEPAGNFRGFFHFDPVASEKRFIARTLRGQYRSDVIQTSGGTFYRNRAGRCEDAPCCGCCTI